MTPESSEECQREIDHLRRHELDFDELFVDAIDPNDGEVVARLYLQFRAPFSSRRQEGYGMTHQDQTKGPVKWQYDFSITEDDSARVLHEFSNEYSAMKCEPSLSYSKEHDKFRDAELRRQAEHDADGDAVLNEKIENAMQPTADGTPRR
jgi:hypothetical protein